MQLTYVSRPWITQAFLKVVRFVFGIFAAAGVYPLYKMLQELGKDKSISGMSLLSLLVVVVIAGGISATSSFFLMQGRSIRASAQGVRLATVKWLSSLPEEFFVRAALNLRKRIGEDASVRETFLMQRAKVIEQLRPLQADENLRGWAANQMAAVRCFCVLDISSGATTDDAERKRLGEEVFSQAFAENGLDEFQKHFPPLHNVGLVGQTEWCIAGTPKYVLTTDRLLIPGKRNQAWSSVPLSEVTELTVRG
jgi:hypothetical protein